MLNVSECGLDPFFCEFAENVLGEAEITCCKSECC